MFEVIQWCRRLTVGAVAVMLAAGCASTMRDGPPPVNYIPGPEYHLLMAEIAVQREQFMTAAGEYLVASEQGRDVEVARRATEFSLDYDLDQYALRAATRWAVLAEDDSDAHSYLTALSLRRNDLETALGHARQALGPVATRSDEAYLEFGAGLADEDNSAGVTRLLTRLMNEDPQSAGLRFALASAAYRSGDYALALNYALQAPFDDGRRLQADLLIARTRVAMGDADLGLAYLEARIRADGSLGLALEYVRLLGASGRTEAALENLERLSSRYGKQPEFVRLRALISFSAGDLATASRDFNDLLDGGTNVYECFYYLGRIASVEGRHRSAIRYFSRIGAGAYLFPAQLSISRAYEALDEPQAGIDHLAGFAASHPRYAFDVLEPRAQLLQGMQRPDDALRELDLALKYKPDTIRLLIGRGAVFESLGRLDEALSDMRRAAELGPQQALPLNTLGYTLTNRTRRHDEAYGYIRRALELESDSPAIIDSMGWVLFKQGRPEEARFYLQQAWTLLPDPEVAAHLGEVLWVTGEQDAARSLWESSLVDYPDSVPLNETMERLLK